MITFNDAQMTEHMARRIALGHLVLLETNGRRRSTYAIGVETTDRTVWNFQNGTSFHAVSVETDKVLTIEVKTNL